MLSTATVCVTHAFHYYGVTTTVCTAHAMHCSCNALLTLCTAHATHCYSVHHSRYAPLTLPPLKCAPLTLRTTHTVHHSHYAPLTLRTTHTTHHSHYAPLTLRTTHTMHHSCYAILWCAPLTWACHALLMVTLHTAHGHTKHHQC